MSNAAKSNASTDDVLASIRRLVAEESARGDASAEASRKAADRPADPQPSFDDAPTPERVLRRRAADAAGVADRQAINRAARAKLLLTDDFRVAEMAREAQRKAHAESEAPEAEADDWDQDDTVQMPDAAAEPSPSRAGRSAIYSDEDQARLSEDIDAFLSADAAQTDDAAAPDDDTTDIPAPDAPQEMSFEDIPDELLSASRERAARRREAALQAEATSRASAAQRAAQALEAAKPVEEAEEVEEAELVEAPDRVEHSDPAPTAMPDPDSVPVVEDAAPARGLSPDTVDQIEAAVRASLQAYANQPAAQPEAELVLDEEMLRDMVSEIVKRELQGSLGERITRNVRKLVRREIYRALEARDLG